MVTLHLAGSPGMKVATLPLYPCVANGLTNIGIAAACHPLTVELDFQFVVAQCEDAKIVAVIFLDAVDLGGSDDMRFCGPVCAPVACDVATSRMMETNIFMPDSMCKKPAVPKNCTRRIHDGAWSAA